MSKEKYKQIIDEVYENYTQNTPESHVAGSDSDPMKLSMDWKGKNDYSSGYPILERLSQEQFINKIKTNPEFSQKWGLKIEERELSTQERNEWYQIHRNGNNPLMKSDWKFFELDQQNIPTKLITLTYQNEKIESYE